MPKDEIITGIDLGSSAVRVVVGNYFLDSERNSQLQIIGIAESPSEGISKGVITSIEDAVSSLSSALEKAERMSGVPIENAFVSISGGHILSQSSRGVIAVSKANGEITEDDVSRVIEAAQAVASPPNYEILHVIPKNFSIDNQIGIKDPLGMTGVRLEVETQIIQSLSSQIKNLTKAVYRTGIDISDLIIAPLAASESVLNKRQKELGVALLNIGDSISGFSVFEEGDLIHTSILPIGSGHITSDIAIGLRISRDIAEQIKILYGNAVLDELEKDEKISLKEFTGENIEYPKSYISAIIEARLEEIFDLADRELRKIGRSGLLPAGVVLSGGGAKLNGIVEIAKNKFKLPACLGRPNVVSSIEKVNDPAYAVPVGLVMWNSRLKDSQKDGSRFSGVDDIKNKIKGWFKSLIP